mgnify:CR=1 FL=1
MNIHNFTKYKTTIMQKKELKKNLTKFYLSNKYKILKSNKILKKAYNYKYFFKPASNSYFRSSCLKLGSCRSVFRFFKMSRYICRFYASNGLFIGLRKASF